MWLYYVKRRVVLLSSSSLSQYHYHSHHTSSLLSLRYPQKLSTAITMLNFTLNDTVTKVQRRAFAILLSSVLQTFQTKKTDRDSQPAIQRERDRQTDRQL